MVKIQKTPMTIEQIAIKLGMVQRTLRNHVPQMVASGKVKRLTLGANARLSWFYYEDVLAYMEMPK